MGKAHRDQLGEDAGQIPCTPSLSTTRTARRETAENGVLEELLRRNVKQFRAGLVFKAHRLVYHPTLGSTVMRDRLESNKEE